jgi:nucleotide-binding universal stress UspA family protein
MHRKHMLVAVDYPGVAESVNRVTIGIARQIHARVTLLHVDPLSPLDVDRRAETTGFRQRFSQEVATALQKRCDQLQRTGLHTDVRIVAGNPIWHTVLSIAAKEKADFVVTGRPSGEHERYLLGGTTTRLIRHATLPVLVANSDAGEDTEPREAGEGAFSIRHLVTTTDFSSDSERGLRAALKLADCCRADLALVHVLHRFSLDRADARADGSSIVPDGMQRRRQAKAQAKLDTIAGLANHSRLRTELLQGNNVAKTLARCQIPSDLVVMPSHGQGAIAAVVLGSTVERFLRLTSKPVLVLRRPYLEEWFEAYATT